MQSTAIKIKRFISFSLFETEITALRAVQQAESACLWRDAQGMLRSAGLITTGPSRYAEPAASFYSAAALLATGESTEAGEILSALAEGAGYWAERARLKLAASRWHDSAADYEQLAGSPNLRIAVEARLMIASLRADLDAIAALLAPARRLVGLQGHVLNNLAVELCRGGNVDAAGRVIAVAMAHPLARVNGIWHETAAEVERERAAQERLQSRVTVLEFLNEQTRAADLRAILRRVSPLGPAGMRRARRAVEKAI